MPYMIEVLDNPDERYTFPDILSALAKYKEFESGIVSLNYTDRKGQFHYPMVLLPL